MLVRFTLSVLVLLAAWGCAANARGPETSASKPRAAESTLPRVALVDRSKACSASRESPLRLLTPLEYANTLGALFPGVALPASVELTSARTRDDALGLSSLVLERHVGTALELGKRAGPKLREQSGCQAGDSACFRRFFSGFGLRVFRRPLSEAESARFGALFDERAAGGDLERAFAETLSAFLIAPQFLYRMDLVSGGQRAAPTNYDIASRLSYLLWQSAPDDVLFEVAARGELQQPNKVSAQVSRMLADAKASGAFVSFVSRWFDLDKILFESKSSELFQHWLPHSGQSAVDESKAFVRWVYQSERPTLANLLLSRHAEVDDAMAAIYGVAPTGKLQSLELDPAQRGGLLTRTAFLAGRAHAVPSPPLRGSFVLRNLLCETLPAPPPNVNNLVPSPHVVNGPSTNRQRFELAIAGGRMCVACHVEMDPLGYAFENYDATGRYVLEEQGLAVNATVNLSKLGLAPEVDGGVAISEQLASSPEVAYCASAMLFSRAFQRVVTARDWCHIDAVYTAFARSGGNFKVALASIATSPEYLR